MRQLATGFFTCRNCDAAYDSEVALQEHKYTAHRGRGSAQRLSEPAAAPASNSQSQSAEQHKTLDTAEKLPSNLSRVAGA